jgi:hypothetical protein
MLAQETEFDAERVFPAKAIGTGTVADTGVDDDEVVCTVEDPHSVPAHDPGRCDGDPREAAQDKEVEVVQGSGEHSDANLARAGGGNWEIGTVFEAVKAAVS